MKDEWIVGKALFTIPLVGYLPLHIVEVVIVVAVIMILYEFYLRSRESEETGESGGKQKKEGRKEEKLRKTWMGPGRSRGKDSDPESASTMQEEGP